MPHQCTNCDRTFDDGSKEMLSGCPDCGGNKFQFKPEGTESADASAEPPDPPEPPEPTGSSVAQTVGKTAATVKDLMPSGSGNEPTPTSADSGAESVEQGKSPQSTIAPAREDTAQASARSDIVPPEDLPSEPSSDDEHHFQPVSADDRSPDVTTGADVTSSESETATEPSTGGDKQSNEDQPRADRPGLDELREELNDQFESVKVLSPGQYELNLMELYEREEYIVALEEDGRYSIQVPENFRD